MIKYLFALVCACAFAAAGAAHTVHAEELQTISGGDLTETVVIDESLPIGSVSGGDFYIPAPLSSYDSYYGSISGTYLEYMRGYLSKLSPTEHYIAARVSQYDYIFAYGEDLTWTGSGFSGAVKVAKWNTYNYGTFSVMYDSNFYLNPASALVYTDLTDTYPALATSSDFTLRQILILLVIFCLVLTMDHMYQVRKIRRIAKGGL